MTQLTAAPWILEKVSGLQTQAKSVTEQEDWLLMASFKQGMAQAGMSEMDWAETTAIRAAAAKVVFILAVLRGLVGGCWIEVGNTDQRVDW